MKRGFLICILLFALISQANAYPGCCLNPSSGACQKMDSEACCPAGGSMSADECIKTYFVKSNEEYACATLPEDKASLCSQGCCCSHLNSPETGINEVTAKQQKKVECQGQGLIWKSEFSSCDEAFCASQFGVSETTGIKPKKPETTTIDTTTTIEPLSEPVEPTWSVDTSGYSGDKCARAGGSCRKGLFNGGILALIGLVPWCKEGESRITSATDCGTLKACCKSPESNILTPMSLSDSSYKLTFLGSWTVGKTENIAFTAPRDGTLFYKIDALKSWWPFKKSTARVYLNSEPIAATSAGQIINQIKVKKGDKIYSVAEGNTCFLGLFGCTGWGTVKFAYGTSSGKGLGTGIALEEFYPGFPLRAYVGEQSDEPIIECILDWGDGNSEAVPTSQFGQIHYFEHDYARALTTEAEIKYTCRTENQVSEATESIFSSVSCYESTECEGNSPDVLCATGFWSCDFNECVWNCPEMCDIDSDCESQNQISDCEGGFWSCGDNKCIWTCPDEEDPDSGDTPDKPEEDSQPEADPLAKEALNKAINECISYCQSDNPNVQINFFNINKGLEVFKEQLGLEGTNCLFILDDISPCSESFKSEFSKLAQ